MLFLNDKLFDLSDMKNPRVQEITEQMREIQKKYNTKKHGGIMFKTLPARVKQDPDNPGKKIEPAGYAIEMCENVSSKYGSEQWRYCTSFVSDNGRNIYKMGSGGSDRLEFRKSLLLDDKEKMDLIWFLLFCSKRVENNHVKSGKQKYIIVENKESDAQKAVIREQMIAKTNYLIMDNNSPLNEQMLRTIAKSMNIPGVNDLTLDEVRLELKGGIEIMERTRKNGYHTFLMLSRGGERLEKRVLIQECIDKRRIANVAKAGVRKWVWIMSDGTHSETPLCIIPPTAGNAEEYLLEELCGNKELEQQMRLQVVTIDKDMNIDEDLGAVVPTDEELASMDDVVNPKSDSGDKAKKSWGNVIGKK